MGKFQVAEVTKVTKAEITNQSQTEGTGTPERRQLQTAPLVELRAGGREAKALLRGSHDLLVENPFSLLGRGSISVASLSVLQLTILPSLGFLSRCPPPFSRRSY
jgi:hypothetical protein